MVINGAIGWAMFRGVATIPLWGASSIGGDTLGTSFFLPAITCLIVTPLVRGQVRKGAAPAFARRARRLAAPVPARARRCARSRSGSSASPLAGGAAVALLAALGVERFGFGAFLALEGALRRRARGLRAAGHRAARARGPAAGVEVPATACSAPAGPADLDALLPMLERFNATQGIAFDAAAARRALGELLARPELGRVYRIVEAGATVGYGALTFGWSLEWGGRDAFIDEIFLEAAAARARASAARRCAR